MLTGSLFHVAIRTQDLDATVAFYTRVLGMALDERPPFDFPGAWIKPNIPGAGATIHVYAGSAAISDDGVYQTGTAAVDHVSILAHGLNDYRKACRELGLPWRENRVPKLPLDQLFVYDPNGILLELTFHAHAEAAPYIPFPPELQYHARERWFNPQAYRDLVQRLGHCSTQLA
jgi:catechol 2,3-dioxygenase-like lactoylglutathione lyase family enzyme